MENYLSSVIITFVFMLLISMLFWYPFFTGKKMEVTVDDYVHPKDSKKDKKGKTKIEWIIRFVYREKNGKKTYAYSKRKFDTRPQISQDYPIGKTVLIRNYHELGTEVNYNSAIILEDKKDLIQSVIYTVLILIAGSAILFGNYMLIAGR